MGAARENPMKTQKLRSHNVQTPPIALPPIWRDRLQVMAHEFGMTQRVLCQESIQLGIQILQAIEGGERVEITIRDNEGTPTGWIDLPREFKMAKH